MKNTISRLAVSFSIALLTMTSMAQAWQSRSITSYGTQNSRALNSYSAYKMDGYNFRSHSTFHRLNHKRHFTLHRVYDKDRRSYRALRKSDKK